MTRRRVVAGNWKMNHGPEEAEAFVGNLPLGPGDGGGERGPDVALFPPAISLAAAARARERRREDLVPLTLGVQNVHWEDQGAFTGETSAPMARAAGAVEVLVGHSERRHVFGETDAQVEAKVRAVRRAGLTPVVCVGENLEEREEGRVEEVLVRQVDAFLPALSPEDGGKERRSPGDVGPDGSVLFRVAYEPVWAIGTGRTATPGDAGEAHALIRRRVGEVLGTPMGETLTIMYGGSVKPENAGELMAVEGVDGLLVGGASLDAEAFAEIVRAA